MEEKIYSFNDYKNDLRRKERIDWLKTLPGKGLDWAEKHAVGLTVGVGLAIKLATTVSKLHSQNEDSFQRNKMYYDPSAHVWYELRHKLTNSEKIEIAQRIKNGENRVDILEDMKIIK